MALVQIALYDLSQGMARQLSAPLLGGPEHAIAIIPHTGIVVFGREYFFGGGDGGISAEDPQRFRASRGIAPIQMLDIGTTTVSQSEFEAWCVQQMHNGRYAGRAYDLFHRNCNHFSHDAAIQGLKLARGVPDHVLEVPQKVLASPMGQMMQPMLQGMQVGGGATFVPTGRGVGGSATASSSSRASAQPNPWATTSSTSSATSSTPILDKHSRPLLSNDIKTAVTCASKLEHEDIRAAADLIQSRKTVPREVLSKACDALLALLQQQQGTQVVTFGLMLLRLFVLHDYSTWGETSKCLAWTRQQLKSDLTSPAARSMAWCTMSNAVATTSLTITNELADVVDAAIQDVTSSSAAARAEVKQAAVSFLYNVAVVKKDAAASTELSDLDVSLLCGCMEGLQDAVVRKNCLLVVGHIMKQNVAAAQLLVDLGLDSSLRTLGDGDALAHEICALMDHATKS